MAGGDSCMALGANFARSREMTLRNAYIYLI